VLILLSEMKLLVFAHIPPPHHGQSYMVKLMLDGLGGDWREKPATAQPTGPVQCYHVNSRFSDELEDIGAVRLEKLLLVFKYCFEAIWCRFKFGVQAFYYVPAPGKRAPLYRDWLVMLLCRPFFRHFIHHWEAAGLGDWVRREGTWVERWLTHRLLGNPSLGIVLGIPNLRDALWFRSRDVEIVPNGIPDPCRDFEKSLALRRRARLTARRKLIAGETLDPAERESAGGDPHHFRILYLAHCIAEKGLFDTVDAVALANSHLRAINFPIQVRLTIAGQFWDQQEKKEFETRLAVPEIAEAVHYAGFVAGAQKEALLRENDCLCFPSYYTAEAQPVSIIEAMAFGMVIAATRWRAIPEMLPADYPGFVPARRPAELAAKLPELMTLDSTELRERFSTIFTAESYLQKMTAAFTQLPEAE